MNQSKDKIKTALERFTKGDLTENAYNLLNVLGYRSQRTLSLEPNTADGFIAHFDPHNAMNRERGLLHEWASIDFLFQLTDDEVNQSAQTTFGFEGTGIDNSVYESYLFFALKLQNRGYTRTQLSDITREINKLLMIPAMVLFQCGDTLTFAVIDRRLHKRDESKDVLEKVTLIKDIAFADPHRAHIDILFDLSLSELHRQHRFTDFPGLHEAWKKTLDTELLNKQFYQKLFKWFGWAVKESKFPEKEKRVLQSEQHIIRLITRLLFVWFIKEKRLVADELFDESEVAPLLKDYNRNSGDAYYRAVLQNLFFATLNTEIGKREFSTEKNATHRNFSRYRYKSQISHPDKLLELFTQTPFINGGLFDCLDSEEATEGGGYRIDCFSDRHYKRLSIPNRLFFDEEDGLFPLLKHYKFTVEENTPIEQEVALDPELLGKVFENLLAAYNPETGESARKQTGSYYTPRPIVDYMVEESLVATMAGRVSPTDDDASLWEERVHYLLDYAKAFDDASEWFDDDEKNGLVRAISELKILDPAVGSGAFPMGVLHKLTLALRRLDPDNTRWEQLQKERALQRAAEAFDTKDRETRDEELKEISRIFENYSGNFGRKLYLIQNSIFGVDIQSIACQIAKLRFFISLAIEQEPDRGADNFGIKPLPNLETRFIAANTLIGLEEERPLTSPKARDLERELGDNRERHFHATTRPQKLACKREDIKLRRELIAELRHIGMPDDDAERIVHWDPYDQSATTDWFDSEWMFGVTDGFDVVIGNPPYLNVELVSRSQKDVYAKIYKTFYRRFDVFGLFIEKSLMTLVSKGMVTYIVPSQVLNNLSYRKLRKLMLSNMWLKEVCYLGDKVFKTANNDVCILFLQKPDTEQVRLVSALDFENRTSTHVEPGYFDKFGGVISVSVDESEDTLFDKIFASAFKPIRAEFDVFQGIVTGRNDAYILSEQQIQQTRIEQELLHPVLLGRDFEKWRIRNIERRILYLNSDTDIEKYPNATKWLLSYRDRLEQRRECRNGTISWYALQWARVKFQLDYTPKILVQGTRNPRLRTRIVATIDDIGIYGTQGLNFIVPKSDSHSVYYLLGILNSSLINYIYLKKFLNVAIKAAYLKNTPIPICSVKEQQQLIAVVKEILDAKRAAPDADVSALENEIDQIVYLLYGLTPEEIAIVEENTV